MILTASALPIVLFFSLWLVVWTPIGILIASALGWNPLTPLSPVQKLPFVLSLYALAPFLLAGVRSWAGLSWLSIGISATNLLSHSFFLGLMISGASIVGLFSLFWSLGWVKCNGDQNILAPLVTTETHPCSGASEKESLVLSPIVLLLSLLGLGVVVGGVEELVFRGFLTGRLCELWPVWLSGAIASLIFALLHLVWEGMANSPQLPGLWVMGMVLTLAWWVDDQAIALAWGLHAGWVWSVATIDTLEFIEYTQTVPTWVTGIDNKPLAGLMGIGALSLTGLGIGFLL